jgi:hypothetical protein
MSGGSSCNNAASSVSQCVESDNQQQGSSGNEGATSSPPSHFASWVIGLIVSGGLCFPFFSFSCFD